MPTTVPSDVSCFLCYGATLSEAWKLSLLDRIAGDADDPDDPDDPEDPDLELELALGDFSDGTFSRASSATYDDEAGLIQTALTNVLRDGHYISGDAYTLLENQRTNVARHNRDLTNAVWTKTDVTAAKDQTGADGVANSASSITATGASGTCLQPITISSLQRVTSAYVKRLIGSGTVEMTMNGGSTWTAVTVTSEWTRVQIPVLTLANPSVGFRLATIGDAIAVDFVQCEDRLMVTTPIATAGASVSRAVDSLALRVPAKPETVVYETPDGKYVIYNSRDDIGRFQHTPTKSIQVWDGDKRNDIAGKADLWGVRNGYTRAVLEGAGITTMAQLGSAAGTLDLSSRGLTDCVGFGYATNLTDLRLQLNQLTGGIPAELGQLTNLTQLWLQLNQLTGGIPAELGQLTNLTQLQLQFNQLTGSIPAELGQLTNLTRLWLQSNQLTGSIPAELGQLTNLTELRIDTNQLTGSIPAELGQLTNLTQLYLFTNQLTGSIPAELGQLTNLTQLQLQLNQLTGGIPAELGQLTNLTQLWLQSNQFTQTDLENFIDVLWDNRVQLGSNNCDIRMQTNPGSAGAATSKASEISDLQAAGCTVVI